MIVMVVMIFTLLGCANHVQQVNDVTGNIVATMNVK